MHESKLTRLADPLREMIGQFDMFIRGFREERGVKIAGTTCDMLPCEIIASMGLVPVRAPSLMNGPCAAAGMSSMGDIGGLYDCVVVPTGCAGRGAMPAFNAPLYEFPCPAGWGQGSAAAMKSAIDDLLSKNGCAPLSGIDPAALRSATMEYNAVRRLVRGIASVRAAKPDLLSCRDLSAVHEAACVFPPALAHGRLAPLLDALNRTPSGAASVGVPVLVYASFQGDTAALDEIEEAGCVVVEDDACGGRRQFDMSYDHESPDLFNEIIDAFSYRPRCPSVRTVDERVELFYSMIKGHGIEAVVFIEDLCCPARRGHIDELRVRLMRTGVDPIVVSSADAGEVLREFVKRI